MKHNKTRPCAECPFRKGCIPGYLGPWTVDDLLQQVHSESGFACHMSVKAQMEAGMKEGSEKLANSVEQCAGAVIHATKSCKTYRDNIGRRVYGLPEGVTAPLSIMQETLSRMHPGDSEVYESVMDSHEFRKYHDFERAARVRERLRKAK